MILDTDLLRLAEKLSLSTTEPEWRCAVSRAYYAAFHHGRDLLQALGFEPPRGEIAHAYLWRRLQSCGNPSLGMAGSDLNQLRGQRNRADYDLAGDVSHRTAMTAVETAAAIFRIIDALTPDDREVAIEIIKAYERDVLREPTWRPRPR